MTGSFLSAENKSLIWSLLQEANAFINIPDTYFDRVRNLYEKIISEINGLADKSLKERNKLVIMKMLEQLPFLKQNNLQKPLQEVKVEVDRNFKDKQDEFIQLVSHKPPEQTRFDEETDAPIGATELNTRLNELMAARNHDIVAPIDTPQEETNSNTQENTSIDENNNTSVVSTDFTNKKVSFSSENLLSKLKRIEPTQTNPNISDIGTLVNTIEINQRITLSNQDKIITLLTTIVDKLNIENADENIIPQQKILKNLSMIIAKFTILDTLIKEKHSDQASNS
jgi:hypothetical protein